MKRRFKSARNFPPAASTARGYSLAELLAALVVSAIIIAAAGSTLLVFLGSSRKYETGQRQREAANRFNYLVQVEASEAKSVTINFSGFSYPDDIQDNCPVVSGVTPLFIMNIPESKGRFGETGDDSHIFYYLKGGDVWRCGPSTQVNGQLTQATLGSVPAGSTTDPELVPPPYEQGIIVRGASIQVATNASLSSVCGSRESSRDEIVYSMTFGDSNWRPECNSARVKTVYVCSPAIGTETLGDLEGLCETRIFDPYKSYYYSKDLNYFRDLGNRFS